jgi:hypothetical protein
LCFDFWWKDVEPVWTAEDVWMHVYDLPPFALDDFLTLWAFGDLFGKTEDIDMVFTRTNNVLRILITCLDPTIIPASLDMKIRNDFFRLRFEVEGYPHPPVVHGYVINLPKNGDNMDEDGDGNIDGAKESDREVKRKKNDETNNDDSNGSSPAHVEGKSLSLCDIKFGSVERPISPLEVPLVALSALRYDKVLLDSSTYVTPKCLSSVFKVVSYNDDENVDGIFYNRIAEKSPGGIWLLGVCLPRRLMPAQLRLKTMLVVGVK